MVLYELLQWHLGGILSCVVRRILFSAMMMLYPRIVDMECSRLKVSRLAVMPARPDEKEKVGRNWESEIKQSLEYSSSTLKQKEGRRKGIQRGVRLIKRYSLFTSIEQPLIHTTDPTCLQLHFNVPFSEL